MPLRSVACATSSAEPDRRRSRKLREGGSSLTRAAASSIASGSLSRREQISTTGRPPLAVEVEAKSHRPGALREELHRRVLGKRWHRVLVLAGTCSGARPVAITGSRAAAGAQQRADPLPTTCSTLSMRRDALPPLRSRGACRQRSAPALLVSSNPTCPRDRRDQLGRVAHPRKVTKKPRSSSDQAVRGCAVTQAASSRCRPGR